MFSRQRFTLVIFICSPSPLISSRWKPEKNKTMSLYWHFTTRSVQSMERRDCFNDKYAWSACRTHTGDQKVIDQHWDAHNITGWRFNLEKWLAYVAQGRIKGSVEPVVLPPPAPLFHFTHFENTQAKVYYFCLQVQPGKSSGDYQSYITPLMVRNTQVNLWVKGDQRWPS